jgi:iron complex outermembrane receptor protein
LILLGTLLASNAGAGADERDLASASMEELMNIEVVTAGRKEQKLSRAAAAVFVITQEDIRRSGATSIPEILRIVPGLNVARIDANKWAVSARGFNGRYAGRMLVMIDGRSVYTNQEASVYWDQQDVLLEDIDRIEVIRGPGATLWGTNAVNGVISIITKKARDTQGGLVSFGAGRDDRPLAAARYGGRRGERLHYRIFAKAFRRADMRTEAGLPANDHWSAVRGGGRLDWQLNPRDALSVHGNLYDGTAPESVNPALPLPAAGKPADEISFSGGYAQARWERRLSTDSAAAVQFYFNELKRRELFGRARLRTGDFDFQHSWAPARRHAVTWGAGYRMMADHVEGTSLSSDGTSRYTTPVSRVDHLISAFVQDDFTIAPDRLVITAGAKIQRNTNVGVEVQPSIRFLWTPDARRSFWGAVSRAVRAPTAEDRDLRIVYSVPSQTPGERGTTSQTPASTQPPTEVLVAYEAGYRRQLSRRLALDAAGYYNRYRDLQFVGFRDPSYAAEPRQVVVVPAFFASTLAGSALGLETALTWNATARWRLSGGHTWTAPRLHATSGAQAGRDPNAEWRAPSHQFQIRSSLDLGRRWSLDSTLYYVSALRHDGIPGYARLDAHLNWKLGESTEVSGGVRNVPGWRSPEFKSEDYSQASRPRPDAYLQIAWRF